MKHNVDVHAPPLKPNVEFDTDAPASGRPSRRKPIRSADLRGPHHCRSCLPSGGPDMSARYGLFQEDAPLLPPTPIKVPKRAMFLLDEMYKAGPEGITTI